ncbi:hypothetical protein Vi05172_g12753 [Venturia inaequalis]|nr:hypothetical protein Vi05172_g12753 [Venturia inaequalis]
MKFTAVLAFLAFATTTIAVPVDPYKVPTPKCSNGCPQDRFGECPSKCYN